MRFLIGIGLLLIGPTAIFSDQPEESISQRQLVHWMKQLAPLQKVHYSWPIQLSGVSDEQLYEYTRLTHAVSLSGEWCNPEAIDRAVEACRKVNSNKPKHPASIAINFSVWHRRFGKEQPPTDVGKKHKAELDFLKKRMTFIRRSLISANRRHKANVKVTAILFDCERFLTKKDDQRWNDAINKKLNDAYEIVNHVFPGARIEWYGRGGVHRSASRTGWSKRRWSTLEEKGVAFSCSLYAVPENGNVRETFRRTAEHAEEHGCQQVTPWIALASGYRRQPDQFHKFSMDWNYDLIYSWQLGRELNQSWFGKETQSERYAPWDKAKIAVFYPAPFYKKSPHWGQHFVAYVRGANGIKQLPEIEPSRLARAKTASGRTKKQIRKDD